MIGWITASAEVGCKELGYDFASKYDILKKAPEATRTQKNPLAVSYKQKTHTMDGLFGIGEDGYYLFYSFEADTGAEGVSLDDIKRISIYRHIEANDFLLSHEMYEADFG